MASISKKRKRGDYRQLFRFFVRNVIINLQWLADGDEQAAFSLNAKKNIAFVLRKEKHVGLLTLHEKRLIQTPHAFRTVEDRKKLVKMIADLKCFARFPPKIRARLVPFVKFMSVPHGQALTRVGQEPLMVYFILSGEVEVKEKIFDPKLKFRIEVTQQIIGAGDSVGESSLLEKSVRQFTTVAKGNVELLMVLKEDYNNIIRPFSITRWNAMKDAIKALGYFDYFAEEQIRSALNYGSIQQYKPLEKVFEGYKGATSSAYFVLSGECTIIQNLRTKVHFDNKSEKCYELLSELQDELPIPFKSTDTFDVLKFIESKEDQQVMKEKHDMQLKNLEDVNAKCRHIMGESIESILRVSAKHSSQLDESSDDVCDDYDGYEDVESYDWMKDSYSDVSSKTVMKVPNGVGSKHSQSNTTPPEEEGGFSELSHSSSSRSTSLRSKKSAESGKDLIENHFIQVGSVSFGGIVGLGEEWHYRVMIARTNVVCLAIPRYWLFQPEQNPNAIWNRRLFYLKHMIPNRKKLFEDFLQTRKWEKFKHDLVDKLVNPSELIVTSKREDIPAMLNIIK